MTNTTPQIVTLPSGVTAFGSITAGAMHTCAAASAGANAGKIYCWGYNSEGEVGDNSTTNRSVPTPATMPSGVTAFSKVAAGYYHSCAIASAGTNVGRLYCWGWNAFGQVGDNTTTNRLGPTLAALPSGVTAFGEVAPFGQATCALASAGANAGKVYCWGANDWGQLGDNTSTARKTPASVTMPSGVTAFSKIAGGMAHMCALASAGANAGKVYCWGYNADGEIGDGTTSGSPTRRAPTLATMPGGVTAFGYLTVGEYHACAIASGGAHAGKAYCWGRYLGGNLGDGTTSNRTVPTVVTMPSGVTFTKIDAGSPQTCAY